MVIPYMGLRLERGKVHVCMNEYLAPSTKLETYSVLDERLLNQQGVIVYFYMFSPGSH